MSAFVRGLGAAVLLLLLGLTAPPLCAQNLMGTLGGGSAPLSGVCNPANGCTGVPNTAPINLNGIPYATPLSAGGSVALFGDSITANSDQNNAAGYSDYAEISAGTYNSSTGAVSLTIAAASGLSSGSGFTVAGITGTGAVARLDGPQTATSGTSGTTLNFTAATGLTLTITGGGVLAAATPCSTTCDTYNSGGYGTWLSLYTNNRVNRTANTANFGVVGDTAEDMNTPLRTGPVLASGASIIVMDGGVNSIAVLGDTCATVETNLRQIYQTFLQAGRIVIRIGIWPENNSTSTQKLIMECVNQSDRRYQQETANFYFVDTDGVMTDPAQSAWTVRSGYLRDNVHPNAIGGSALGYAIAGVINQLVPNWPTAAYSNTDVFDATNNPAGNLLVNGSMQGAAGTPSGDCSGTVVSNATLTGSTGATCVATTQQIAGGNGAYEQVITLSGASTGASPVLTFAASTTSLSDFSTGDMVEGCAWVRVTGPTLNLAAAAPVYVAIENATTYYNSSGYGANATPLAAAGWASNNFFNLCTPRHVVTTSPTAEKLDIWIQLIGGTSMPVAGTIEIGPMTLRKVFN